MKRKGDTAQRWLFVDNTTKGKLPFIRGESSFKGMVPGMIENITKPHDEKQNQGDTQQKNISYLMMGASFSV